MSVTKKCIFFLVLSLVVTVPVVGFAAQSSGDNYINAAERKKMLEAVVGKKAATLESQSKYVIGHGDILTVYLFEEGDMSASALAGGGQDFLDAPKAPTGIRVMMDGRISLKDIGDVEVVGLTLTELADYLKKLYSVIYIDPIVTTTLVKSNSLRYTVMGEVGVPGVFLLDFPMTLVQVIARSGGFAEWSDKTITVVRKNISEKDASLFEGNTLKFDYDDFLAGKNLPFNILVQSGDYIIVQ